MNRDADKSQWSYSEQNVTKHTVASTPCVHAPSAVVRAFKGWTAAHVSVFLLSHSLKPVLTAHAEMGMGSLDPLYLEFASASVPLTRVSSCTDMLMIWNIFLRVGL